MATLGEISNMSFREKLREELVAVALTTFYFALWLGYLMALKVLVLSEYRVEFHDWSLALVGALVLAKVVLVLEHVSLGEWTRGRPAAVEVLLRTGLYALGVLVVLILERAFEGRHEHGGLGASVRALFEDAEIHHVWASAICLAGALLVYNVQSVVGRHLGGRSVRQLLSSPLPSPASAAGPPREEAAS
jgi:hypothetical protein